MDAEAPHGFSVWDIASGRRLTRLPMAQGFDGLQCGFLRRGMLLGFGHRDNPAPRVLARLWSPTDDLGHPRLLEQFEGLPNLGLDWSGGELLTHEDRSTVLLRDALTGRPVRAFRVDDEAGGITAAACSPGADLVAAVSGPPWR